MSVRDLDARRFQGADIVFEGVPESIRSIWDSDKTKAGDLIPATLKPAEREYTFKVTRGYKGTNGSEVKITTGFGMGDCGESFRADTTYVIYADREDDGRFYTGICSGNFEVNGDNATLRFLRGEPPLPSDLLPPQAPSTGDHWSPPTNMAKLCGSVITPTHNAGDNVSVFLSRKDKLGLTLEDATDLEDDGTFCFNYVDSGKYVLGALITSDNSATGLTYYPGVATAAEATPIEVRPGDRISKLLIAFPKQNSVEVTGRVVPQNASLPSEGVSVMLIGNSDFPMMPGLIVPVGTDGTFKLDDVRAGHYELMAVINDSDKSDYKWLTRKVAIDVSDSVSGIQLDLIPRK